MVTGSRSTNASRLRPEDVADFSYLLADLGPLLGLGTEQRLDAL
jgi:hypothetical protein